MNTIEARWPPDGFLRSVLDASSDCIKVVCPRGTLRYMNANGLCAMQIDDFEAIRGREWASLWPPESAETVRRAVAAAVAGQRAEFEAICPTNRGVSRWWEVSVGPILDEGGGLTGIVSVSRDVTERRRADEALRESEARFRNLADQAPFMIWVADRDGTCTYVSRSWTEFTGRTLETGGDWQDLVHPEDLPAVLASVRTLHETHETARFEYRLRRADGVYRWVMDVAVARFADGGAFLGFAGSVIDVTERREREEETRRYRTLVEQSSDFIGFATLDRQSVFANEGARRLVGAPPDLDLTSLDILDFFLPEDQAYVAEVVLPQQLAGEPWVGESRFRHFGTGEAVPVWYNAFPIKDESGRVTALATVTRDIGDQKRAETALRSSEEHLRVAQTAGRIATWEWNLLTDAVTWSATMMDLLGLPADTPMSYAAFAERVMAEDRPGIEAAVGLALEGAPYDVEFRVVRPCGAVRWLAGRAEVMRDRDGRPLRMIGVNYDVTLRREATDALAALNADLEARARESAGKLVQLEKMESIGRLTGGIAHDFNNLLSVVLSNLEVLRGLVRRDPRMTALVDGAMRGADRGAALTERLLAFARRQELNPAPVDIPDLVAGMGDLLARSLGPRIRIETRFAPGLPPALVDANQLELALLNLAVNARDAMPEGGKLVIEADLAPFRREGSPGPIPYLRLRVVDEGVGMDADRLRRAMEPFYTTKPVGQGTGLGLAIVHGLAVQSGGDFTLRSAPGQGTSAEILLPLADHPVAPAPAPMSAAVPLPSVPLRVMVVDDDEAVLEASVAMVEAMGHVPLRARSGPEALNLLACDPDIQLVVTDYLMPDMTGLDLARRMRDARPGLPVILATGYADAMERADLTLPRLAKPFRQGQLASLIADVTREMPA